MNSKQINDFLDHFTHLLTRGDVTSIDVRAKSTGGKRTDQLALVVGVVRKRPPTELAADVLIPPRVEANGVELPTDVFEEGELRFAVAEGGGKVATVGLKRAGSLGVNINYQGAYNLLSCAHVLTAFDPGFIGKMIQYADEPGMKFTDLVPVSGQQPVTFYESSTQKNPVLNTSDVAWGNITPALGSPSIKAIGVPAGIRAAVVNEAVQIYGGESQSLEKTKVLSTTGRVTVRSVYSDDSTIYSFWQNAISLDATTAVFMAGDSGSAVVATSDQKVIGLLFNIGLFTIYACPL
ncbi:MAG: hypothetical protein DMF56_18525 [Acidobacteria bacterium]|nr:MAG: hypothetical protein DMF56_18525 [Acidobacteriota bacterium]